MAKDLMRGSRVSGWMLLLLLSTIPGVTLAQALADPTKPPAELSVSPGETVPTNSLQSIIISPTRRAAIINGQTVELGGKSGDDRLIEVSESRVVLQGANGRQVLSLFPNVEMNKKAVLLPMEDDIKSPVQKKALVTKPVHRTGKKEEK
jgi:hypothetical protein